jgi:hypothetical protein
VACRRPVGYLCLQIAVVMKIRFTTTILKFDKKGEKTGWTYIEVPADLAQRLKPGNRKSFRVKGRLDRVAVAGLALLPMGDGTFILTLNAPLRKRIGKRHGARLAVTLEEDQAPLTYDADLLRCLADEPAARAFFEKLAPSHRGYYSRWIASAKTDATKARRIAQCIEALVRKQHYGQMVQDLKHRR